MLSFRSRFSSNIVPRNRCILWTGAPVSAAMPLVLCLSRFEDPAQTARINFLRLGYGAVADGIAVRYCLAITVGSFTEQEAEGFESAFCDVGIPKASEIFSDADVRGL